MRIVLTGLLGQYAFGGVTWDYLQYVLGFRALGHEVWYLEDSGAWPYDPVAQTISADCRYNVAYLDRVMRKFSLADRWIYRNGADGVFYGAGESRARELLKHADLLINVSSAGWLRDYDLGVKHRMFIDGDPLFSQVNLLDPARAEYAARVRDHESHFTFGLNMNGPDCLVPQAGITWRTTVQPIALELWPRQMETPLDRFTTVMNWASYPPVFWQGVEYGQKDREFLRFRHLPRVTPQPLVVALGQGVEQPPPSAELRQEGWTLQEAATTLLDYQAYHEFLRTSKAEWSVAKHGYVAARTGWFSGRTACYLALGRPALVQETGWSSYLPAGQGLLSFSTLDEAVAGIGEINAHYAEHQAAAWALAEDHFSAPKVCADLLTQAGLG